MYTYPTSSDNLPTFIGLVGTFWTELYGGADFVFDYLRGAMYAQAQLQNDVLELVAAVGRKTCPVFHTENWYAIILNESAASVTAPPGSLTTFPVPAVLKNGQLLVDNFIKPNVALVNGVDYFLDAAAATITFLDNPFVDTSYTVVDGTIQLFMAKAQLDWKYLYEQFGYVVDVNLPSTQNYSILINALWDAVTGGTNYLDIVHVLEAITDVPAVKTDGEIVEVITIDGVGKLVITDQNVYRFSTSATVIVVAGQVVNAGDWLTDTVAILQPVGGTVPNLTALTLPASMFDPAFIIGPLTFTNASTALNVTLNVNGYTKVDWALGGNVTDIKWFFDTLHAKGVVVNKTLAMLLDQRPQPQSTQPVAANLPATINPFTFLCQNVLRNNAFIVTLNSSSFGPNALGTDNLTYLRQIVPPATAMLTVIS